MKKKYEEAVIEVIYLKSADIITESSGGAGEGGGNGDGTDLDG